MNFVPIRKWMVLFCVLILLIGGFLTEAAFADSRENPQWILSGTMRHLNIEGGCWIMEAQNGERYQLSGDPAILKRLYMEGLHVTILVESAYNRYGKCMVGRWVKVIQLIHVGQSQPPHQTSMK
ncbi:hypothetical protein [Marininema halotolerans]|uniref:Uncharacterized protein n=1 Tax=Marininema halotolerans TaxID=1155944 RepID=A0A1I6R2P1_9BACL|nr:hypothetical protein [Marininema halotolerans]SFS58936.1 hypothetical protein SAMN05444972_10455 [Marininema halotolerans]